MATCSGSATRSRTGAPLPPPPHRTQRVQDEHGGLRTDRTAANLLQDAGFIDAAHRLGDDRPTGGFGHTDVERRQDPILLSPALAPALVSYDVHTEPTEQGFSNHCAVSATLDLDLIPA
ncbi:hypothetical protein [Streptomyces sp. NPDC002205]|uniref:hypothetical protein n=1 Tax=Streptomyces sp. NPDC002205 TaxID=3154411 RepID=UPI003330C23F